MCFSNIPYKMYKQIGTSNLKCNCAAIIKMSGIDDPF